MRVIVEVKKRIDAIDGSIYPVSVNFYLEKGEPFPEPWIFPVREIYEEELYQLNFKFSEIGYQILSVYVNHLEKIDEIINEVLLRIKYTLQNWLEQFENIEEKILTYVFDKEKKDFVKVK